MKLCVEGQNHNNCAYITVRGGAGLHRKTIQKSLVEIIGTHRVLIENYLSLISYEPEQIVIRARFNTISIQGNNLKLKLMHKERLVVVGEILTVNLRTERENA